jgi:tetratricopeptide (TPR) repeat protein
MGMNDLLPPQVRHSRRGVRVIVLALALAALLGGAGYLIGRHSWAYYHFRKAEPAMARGDFDQARAHLALCLEVWPNSGETHFLAARAARRDGAYDETRNHLHRAKELGWVPEALDLEWALLKAQTGDTAEVQGMLLAWVDDGHPESVLILEALVKGYLQTYNLVAATDCLDMWLDREPDNPQAHMWRGEVRDIMRKYKDALADYQRVVDLAPDRNDARLKLGERLLHARRAGDAAPHFETLYERQPGEPAVLLGLARCRHEQARSDEACRLLDALLEARPRDGSALGLRGKIEFDAGHYTEAERWLRRAVAVVPYEYEVVYSFVLVLRQNKKTEEAEDWDARRDRIDADLERINLLMRAIVSYPTDPTPRHEAGMILLRNGQEEAGLHWLANALEQDPNYRPSHELLAEYFEKHGQPEKAAQHRRAAGQGH